MKNKLRCNLIYLRVCFKKLGDFFLLLLNDKLQNVGRVYCCRVNTSNSPDVK